MRPLVVVPASSFFHILPESSPPLTIAKFDIVIRRSSCFVPLSVPGLRSTCSIVIISINLRLIDAMIGAAYFFLTGFGLLGIVLFLGTILLAIAVRLVVLALVSLGIYFAVVLLIDKATASTSKPIALECLAKDDPGATTPSGPTPYGISSGRARFGSLRGRHQH